MRQYTHQPRGDEKDDMATDWPTSRQERRWGAISALVYYEEASDLIYGETLVFCKALETGNHAAPHAPTPSCSRGTFTLTLFCVRLAAWLSGPWVCNHRGFSFSVAKDIRLTRKEGNELYILPFGSLRILSSSERLRYGRPRDFGF